MSGLPRKRADTVVLLRSGPVGEVGSQIVPAALDVRDQDLADGRDGYLRNDPLPQELGRLPPIPALHANGAAV